MCVMHTKIVFYAVVRLVCKILPFSNNVVYVKALLMWTCATLQSQHLTRPVFFIVMLHVQYSTSINILPEA